MATSLSDIMAAMQNGVTAINNLNTALARIFPQTTANSTVAPAAGTVTFTSSQARTFILVTASDGTVYKVPAY